MGGPHRMRREVARQYDRYALESCEDKAGSFARMAGYEERELRSLPEVAVLNSLSCGDPVRFSEMRAGETVVDLGCGAGIDTILAARKVGDTGRVIGVDLSPEMLSLAAASLRAAGVHNASLLAAEMERLPVPSEAADWIVSNCALNLSPEKPAVMAEMARVLRPGGRIFMSDVVADELPDWVRHLSWNFVTCVGLAVGEKEYRALLERAGFENVKAVHRFVYGADEIHRLLEHEYRKIKESFSAEELARIVDATQGRIVKIDWQAERGNARAYRVVPFAEKAGDRPYRDLLCYIVSNTIAGELMGADNYLCMAAATEDFEEKRAFVEDAQRELEHVEMLAGIGKRFDFPVERRIVEPQWKNIRERVRTAAGEGDLVTCRIVQDLMAESQALVLYRFLGGFESEVDALTSGVARAILRDETQHLEAGIRAMQEHIARDAESVHDKLIWAHHRVMPEFFSLIRYGCESLCGVLGMQCESLHLDAFKADLDEVRVNAMESYVEVLERCRFDPAIVASLIAGMASWQDRAGNSGNGCRGSSAGGSSPVGRCCS